MRERARSRAGPCQLVRGERLTPELGDLACVHERRSAPRVRATTAGAPELHGYQQSARRCCLFTDAEAKREPIARRRTPGSRPQRPRARGWLRLPLVRREQASEIGRRDGPVSLGRTPASAGDVEPGRWCESDGAALGTTERRLTIHDRRGRCGRRIVGLRCVASGPRVAASASGAREMDGATRGRTKRVNYGTGGST